MPTDIRIDRIVTTQLTEGGSGTVVDITYHTIAAPQVKLRDSIAVGSFSVQEGIDAWADTNNYNIV